MTNLRPNELLCRQHAALHHTSQNCTSIYDGQDSFPTGSVREAGRVFIRPDLVNIQKLHGKLYNVKYFVILRNISDTVMSSLARNYFNSTDEALRTIEQNLIYMESALRGVNCDQIFLGHYEHVLASPVSFVEPLAEFLELDSRKR